jgi:hypothetical protein
VKSLVNSTDRFFAKDEFSLLQIPLRHQVSAQRGVILDGVGQLGHHAVADLARQIGRAGHVLHLEIIHSQKKKNFSSVLSHTKSSKNQKALGVGDLDSNKLSKNRFQFTIFLRLMYEKVSRRISSFDSFIFGNLPQVKLFPKFLSEMPTQTQLTFRRRRRRKNDKETFSTTHAKTTGFGFGVILTFD